MVLNFKTGDITAQWIVVFEDWFSTVATNVDDMPNFHADEWSKMFGEPAPATVNQTTKLKNLTNNLSSQSCKTSRMTPLMKKRHFDNKC